MLYVIGSGPAGIACATALLNRGLPVTLVDTGLELEAETQSTLSELQNQWDSKKLSSLKHSLDRKNPIKKIYNSDFYCRPITHFKLQQSAEVECLPSFSQGGLSNAWGAVIEKYHATQINDWPISIEQLGQHYEHILKILPTAKAFDPKEIQDNFYRPSQQATYLYKHLTKNNESLNKAGYQFSLSELAVRFKSSKLNCQYCGTCQHGCPLDLIYSAKQTLQELKLNPNFTYINDIIVTKFSEDESKIIIHAKHRITQAKLNFTASQVFCACGPLISTALILKSANWQTPVRFQDSTHFMFPALLLKSPKNVQTEALHTLCQLSLKLNNIEISDYPINLQVYTYMDHYEQQLKKSLKIFYTLLKPCLKFFLNRLLIIQAHLDSRESHAFTLTLKEEDLVIEALTNSKVDSILKKLFKSLKTHRAKLGLIPLSSLCKLSKIGKSFHYGAAMPMRSQPELLETDLLGRTHFLKRLHVVDATVFPSIPAGSITPSIMANAHRIASECVIL